MCQERLRIGGQVQEAIRQDSCRCSSRQDHDLALANKKGSIHFQALEEKLDGSFDIVEAIHWWSAGGELDERVAEVVCNLLRVARVDLPVYAVAQLRIGWQLGGFSLPALHSKLSYSLSQFQSSAPEVTARRAEELQRPHA